MKLLGIHLSPFVRKVCVALAVKGIAYEHEVVMPGEAAPADFKKLSPLGKIPVLVDEDFVLADSSAICEYLEEQYPQPPLMPSDPQDRARARFLEEVGDTRLTESASIIFIERFLNPNMFGNPTDTERAENAENELLPPYLDYLESQVPQEGFLFGDFGTADISIVSPIFNAAYGGYAVDAKRWPRYAAFVERVAGHAAVAAVRAEEAKILAGMRGD